ncbi:hypothetical protein HYH70_15720 [Clostridium botulinum]|uniref:hypothetical protein n=1 Tax=Clostridium botulinum TaxID=1491 RepID=UPI00035BABFA|nr:hypothetical protein [Clostridium botulinum]EPS47736.1 hypothetical protein CFSAN002367_22825 [Clostridium botulinum CFSAN002367]KON10091.1 hypothetical protein ACP52_08095 [Clostridium botulinum]MBY6907032.1 hypothetical protein [Clostridium botulinum]MBY6928546.1 hypothetical protein [Clostridium botulinum]MBY6956141.1 hypothetical protein [Clostridium botulinum]
MKAICDNCKREFEMSQDKLKEKYLGAMYTEVYYECPHCNKKHLVCVMNGKCRRLKKQMELRILNKFKKTNDVDIIIADKEIDNIQKEFKREMDKINGK